MKATECSYANKYPAKRAPTCGCEVCGLRWEIAQLRADLKQKHAGELLKIAAGLLDAKWASSDSDDWPQVRVKPCAVLQAAKDRERRRLMAIQLREIWDGLSAGSLCREAN